jgi:ATP-binding cassette subfamily F protein uup
LYLLTVLIKNPNFLILDEPTNDLDLLTLNKLEDFLQGFGGCLIVVSHDRYFMDKLVDHLFIFEGAGKVRDYNGTYSEYREEEDEKEELAEAERKALQQKKVVVEQPKPVIEKRKMTFKEKHEYETLEKEIAELEEEKVEVEKQLSDSSNNQEDIIKFSLRFESIKNILEEKSIRWLELSELLS